MALGPILLPILSVFKSAGIKQASSGIKGLSKSFGSLAKQAGAAAGAAAAFSQISNAKEFVTTSIDATQKFERNLLALQQTFETATPAISGFIKEVEGYGLSQQQAAQASVFLGSVLKQYGFSTKEAGDETERLVTLAQDLATTYGYDVQDSLLAITALFRGEYDPIEKFGVAMKQNEINAYLAAQGLGHLTGAELANAQATARLELLFERAGDSVGAFTRASDTLYGSQQRLNAIMGNLQVSFGSAFQAPLADVNNALANVAQDGGDQLVDISQELAHNIDVVVPLIESMGNALVQLLAPLEQVLGLSAMLSGEIAAKLKPVVDGFASGMNQLNILLDAGSTALKGFSNQQTRIANEKTFIDSLDEKSFGNQIIPFIRSIGDETDKLFVKLDNSTKLKEALTLDGVAATNLRRDTALVGGIAAQLEIQKTAAKKSADALEFYSNELNVMGLNAIDAQGNLIGLGGIFEEIEEAALQSEAAEALEEIGYSAAQIEDILTRPDWAQIFQDIASQAKIAAMQITDSMTTDVIQKIIGAQQAIADTIKTGFGADSKKTSGTSSAKEEAKDYVQEFLDGIQEEVMKQTARLQLQNMTGSEGLIESILGAENWLQLWTKIKAGIIPLEDLERQFYKTAEGAQELADTAEAWRVYHEEVDALKLQLLETIDAIKQAAAALELTFSDMFSAFDVLPTITAEMGRFESAIVSQLGSIEKALQSAFRNGDLFEEGYNTLRKFARQELAVLQARQRQRDDMAKRFSLSEEIIDEYETAISGAMRLTGIFNSLKDETEKRTTTEVTKGVVALGDSLKEFNVTITREYEETITKVIDKTAGLLDGFKAMAEKSRTFASNLRVLKDMGLDGQLFDQLVSAGVEAGGETAQALVDGGQETVSEISNVFAEINALGAELGEEVATTLYGTGIDLTDGLIEGILSKQEEMEDAAYAMAEAFNKAFQATLSTEIGKVTADKIAKETKIIEEKIAAVEVPAMPEVNPALEQIETLIAGANKALSGQLSSVYREGITGKLGAFEALKQDIISGQLTDLGSVTKNLTSAQLETVATATGGTTVNNYYELKTDTRAGAQKVLSEVQNLTSFTNQNGTLATFVNTR
jgi:hypothetical protein